MSNQSIYKERLEALREQLLRAGLGGYLVPRADEYQGEFVAPYAQRLSWLTGFTGSGGGAVVLKERALATTDGRYQIQIRSEVDTNLYEIGDIVKQSLGQWLTEAADKDAVIGYDPWLFTAAQVKATQEHFSGSLKAVEGNPIDIIWADQPAKPNGEITLFPEEISSLSASEKCKKIADVVKEKNADGVIITMPDSIAWLLNVRGGDVAHLPIILSYLYLGKDMAVTWFIEPERMTKEIQSHIGAHVDIVSPDKMEETLAAISPGRVLIDSRTAPVWFQEFFKSRDVLVIDKPDPCIEIKACKTEAERQAIEVAHIKDGVALVKFLHWLDHEGQESELRETIIADKLDEFRAQDPAYRQPSFPAICGFAESGAIIHYRAKSGEDKAVKGDGLLLMDSGGQYEYGTTDITRTIAIGMPTKAMKENFTRVLKGHIALACAYFPYGTMGSQLDILARKPLWDAGLDYAHGTGHGVGCYLDVHEAGVGISSRAKDILKPGMLISNEPGYYEEGAYGIRIENLIMVEDSGGGNLQFKTVSLAPIDKVLIDENTLTGQEKEWLNRYHQQILEVLLPHLEPRYHPWLQAQCSSL